jgi:prepilin-type N-terminal cleavage/methylation domain-containing protein
MSRKGFTIIELMIVIAIIGILSAVSIVGWWGYQDNVNLKTAAGEVMSDIASCKQRAISEGVQYCIQFTDGSPNYSINASSCTAPTQTQAKNLTSFGSGLTISSTNFNSDRVSFLPRGTLSSNTGRIFLTNSKNSTATITVQITGRAYVSFTMQ